MTDFERTDINNPEVNTDNPYMTKNEVNVVWRRVRNIFIVYACVLLLGIAGVFVIKGQQANSACWDRYNGRVALRALALGGSQASFDPSQIKDPQLRAIIVQSRQNTQDFRALAKKLLPLPQCGGDNPTKLSKEVKQKAEIK